MSSIVPTVKAYMYSTVVPAAIATNAAYANTQVLYGPQPSTLLEDIVMIGNAKTDVEVPTLASNRPMRETTDLTVVISATRRGPGSETQQAATEQAYGLLSAIRDYFKTPGNEVFGNAPAVLFGFIVDHELVESDDPDVLSNGRNAAITATLRFKSRT